MQDLVDLDKKIKIIENEKWSTIDLYDYEDYDEIVDKDNYDYDYDDWYEEEYKEEKYNASCMFNVA